MLINSPSPRKHKYHTYGGCWLHYNKAQHQSFIYVHIPKCASTYGLLAMQNYWTWNYITETTDYGMNGLLRKQILDSAKIYFSILRDPIERWISGIVQCRVRELTNKTWQDIFTQVVFDNHTEPQVSFLDQLDTEKVNWFYCDNDLSTNLNNWTDQYGCLNRINHKALNVINEKSITQQNIRKELIQQINKNPIYEQKLLEFFSEDYKLINSVKFYGH